MKRIYELFTHAQLMQILSVVFLTGIGSIAPLHGQDEKDAPKLDVLDVEAFDVEIALDGNVQAADQKSLHASFVRGLIQNEIDLVLQLCSPTDEQKQKLVDTAEREWVARSSNALQSLIQPQGFESIDLDGLAERSVLDWLESALNADQRIAYQNELQSRNTLRKKAVVANMIESVDKRVGLSYEQMKEVEKAIEEKWKDRWYRSLESTLAGSNAVPEVRLTWISSILSDSQRQSFANKPQGVNFANPVAVNYDSFPRLKLDKRFSMGGIVSSDAIPVGEEVLKKPSAGKKKPLNKVGADPLKQGVDFVPAPAFVK